MAPDQRGSKHSRLRRARKDWVKGNRDRVSRVDEDDESIQQGQASMRPRAIAIDEVAGVDDLPRGQVVRTESGRYVVRLEDREVLLVCQVKRGASTDNDESTLVVIGDYVRVQPLEEERGLIFHVEERRSYLGRTAAGSKGMQQVVAANVDLVLCTIAADRPDFRRTIIDRFIVATLLGGADPVVVLNKVDTLDEEMTEILVEEMAVYDQIGYPVCFVSAMSGEGIDGLKEVIRDTTSVLVGQSGAGKSTIINALIGDELRRTSEVRDKDRRGTHTTVDSMIAELPEGGAIIDTPGLREFGIWDLEAEELDAYFVEFLDHLRDCRYLPCTHTHEPGCAVRAAVEAGQIEEGRYQSYLAIFESLRHR